METLIIRVYRRNRTKPEEIAGLVETVGSDKKRAFQSFAELIDAIEGMVLGGGSEAGTLAERDPYLTQGKKEAG